MDATPEQLKAEIAAEVLVIGGAVGNHDWQEVCRAADHIAHCAAVLDAEARTDAEGVVERV